MSSGVRQRVAGDQQRLQRLRLRRGFSPSAAGSNASGVTGGTPAARPRRACAKPPLPSRLVVGREPGGRVVGELRRTAARRRPSRPACRPRARCRARCPGPSRSPASRTEPPGEDAAAARHEQRRQTASRARKRRRPLLVEAAHQAVVSVSGIGCIGSEAEVDEGGDALARARSRRRRGSRPPARRRAATGGGRSIRSCKPSTGRGRAAAAARSRRTIASDDRRATRASPGPERTAAR